MFSLELTMAEFKLFRDLVFEKSGINYTENKRIILQNRIRRRLRDLDIKTYRDYFKLIKGKTMTDPEMIKFFDEVTTNETSFFRHERQFIALKNMIIPEIMEKSRKRELNVWSAAASMGKEAYTISMVLKEKMELKNTKIKILGTDLNSKVLDMAKQGEYDLKDIRDVPEEYKRYMKIDEKNGIVEMKKELKELITFKRYNLQDSFRLMPKMDIIFCRNVFIYFQKDTQRAIVKKFYENLNPGGFFILGHSETLNGVNQDFIYRKFNNENLMIYQKPID